jgi:hypothetical protein
MPADELAVAARDTLADDTSTEAAGTSARSHELRRLGALAHQARAAARAADRFVARAKAEDLNTGSWLMSCAVAVSDELAAELDALAKSVRDAAADATIVVPVQRMRVRAHQLHAAARAADHFLDQESAEDRDTGGWLIACALRLAEKLAADLDDTAGELKRSGG